MAKKAGLLVGVAYDAVFGWLWGNRNQRQIFVKTEASELRKHNEELEVPGKEESEVTANFDGPKRFPLKGRGGRDAFPRTWAFNCFQALKSRIAF